MPVRPAIARPPVRPLLLLAALGALGACARGRSARDVRPATTGVLPVATHDAAAREQTADQQVTHALNRLAFGPRPGDVERVRAMGVDAWISRQLTPVAIADPAPGVALAPLDGILCAPLATLVDDYTPPALVRAAQRRAADGGAGAPAREDSLAYRQAARRRAQVGSALASARVVRAVTSERQLQEVLVDFWANHFSVFAGKGPLMRHYLVGYERDVLRPHALGRFRDLLGAVAKSPAMLVYLDNAQSAADSGRQVLLPARSATWAGGRARRGTRGPAGMRTGERPPMPGGRRRGLNENYARELLELHTLGVDAGYTQQDIVEVARAFTGWTVLPPRQLAAGMDAGQAARAGRLARPLADGSVFLPFVHDAGAKRVLGQTLPAGRGVEDGEQVLDLLARDPRTARFIATKLARRLVSDTPPAALVARAAATFARTDGDLREVVRTIVTSPEFFSRAAWRAKVKSPFEVVTSALRATNAAPDPTPRTALLVGRLGQPIHGHQAPDGWPETGDAWMNTGAILARIRFGMAVAAEQVPGVRRARWPWPAALDSASREHQVDAVVATLLGGGISPDTRAFLVGGANPLLATPRDVSGLAQVVGLALGAPEFQRH